MEGLEFAGCGGVLLAENSGRLVRAHAEERLSRLASLLGDRRQVGRGGWGKGRARSACGLLLQSEDPPTASGPRYPTILSSFRFTRLPSVLPTAMAVAVAGILRGGRLPPAGKERPRSSRRVTAGAL